MGIANLGLNHNLGEEIDMLRSSVHQLCQAELRREPRKLMQVMNFQRICGVSSVN